MRKDRKEIYDQKVEFLELELIVQYNKFENCLIKCMYRETLDRTTFECMYFSMFIDYKPINYEHMVTVWSHLKYIAPYFR
jgi:hypothetical protein